jgi:hypothetical protein
LDPTSSAQSPPGGFGMPEGSIHMRDYPSLQLTPASNPKKRHLPKSFGPFESRNFRHPTAAPAAGQTQVHCCTINLVLNNVGFHARPLCNCKCKRRCNKVQTTCVAFNDFGSISDAALFEAMWFTSHVCFRSSSFSTKPGAKPSAL